MLANNNIYSERRSKLKSILKNGLVIVLGNSEASMNYLDNTYRFRQDSTFLYFFGIDIPDLCAVIDLEGEDYLFGDDLSIDDLVWTGQMKKISEHAQGAGIEHVCNKLKLTEFIEHAQKRNRKIHFLPQYRNDNKIKLSKYLNIPFNTLNDHASIDAIKAIVKLRSAKDPFEIGELKKAAAIGYDMHVTAMKMAISGESEQKIAGIIEGISLSQGAGVSFPVILSQRGEILHNHAHNGILKAGNMMLVDAGAESNTHYASDYTRTTPINHKFSDRQKHIYNIVLAANNSAREMAKPGKTYLEIHLAVAKIIAEGLKEMGLMKGDMSEAVAKGAHALFFPHGLGHMLGLDVHDMEDYGQIYVGYDDEVRPVNQFGTGALRMGRKLEKGFVITDEPGIYFIPELIEMWQSTRKFEAFINYSEVDKYIGFGGIRLEDNLLITEKKAEIIGKRIPITIEEISAL